MKLQHAATGEVICEYVDSAHPPLHGTDAQSHPAIGRREKQGIKKQNVKEATTWSLSPYLCLSPDISRQDINHQTRTSNHIMSVFMSPLVVGAYRGYRSIPIPFQSNPFPDPDLPCTVTLARERTIQHYQSRPSSGQSMHLTPAPKPFNLYPYLHCND